MHHAPYFTLTHPCPPLAFGTASDRYAKNIAALRLLRTLQRDQRDPCSLYDDERRVLAHYSAFGESALLTRALEQDAAVATLLNDDERHRISQAALTAFYTPQELAHVIWEALAAPLRRLPGTLQILEPACGIGMFVACMPLDLRDRAQITAVELDTVSSDLAHFLHPDVQLHGSTGFESAHLPADHYDLVISNVPFSSTRVFFPGFNESYLKRCLHDFFIARALQLVRPGGIVCVLTSYGTLDKQDQRTRAWIAQQAEFITALRLPQGAFAANSGTMCGADLLILRRF